MDRDTYDNGATNSQSCYNQTFSSRIEPCDPVLPNACISVWELKDFENQTVNVNLTEKNNVNSTEKRDNVNLTEIIENLTLTIKGCWTNHRVKEEKCNFVYKPKRTLSCVCTGDNCNKNDLPNLRLLENITWDEPPSTEPVSLTRNQSHLIIYLFPIIVLLTLIFIFFYKQRNKLFKKLNCMNRINFNGIKQNHLNAIEIKEPLLFKNTPKIIEQLKQGQYCNVYKGKIERLVSTEQLNLIHPGQTDIEQMVAIKTYPQQMYDSFKHEYDVYNLPNLKHRNILKFISAEEKPISPTSREYWLVLEYYENGSLYDYLKCNLITYSQLLEICLNIATGLSYLHNNKNCIVVHRDIKSKNILLKNDLTAVISDFNLALVLYPNQPASENLDQVGTVRYMSPEVLDCAIQFSKEALMKIDIYSTSLVFWEVLSRCSAIGQVSPYLMPYEKELGTFLFKEQLRKHVSENKQRPKIPEHWCDHSDLKEFAKTIKESWDHDAEARLTASGIVERIKRIKMKNEFI